jgi:protease-4
MSFFKKFFNFIDVTRKVILNLFFILALIFIAITFFVSDVKKDHGAVITFAPKKINETTNLNISFFEKETYELNLFEIITAIETASSKKEVEILFMDLTYLEISFTGILEIGTAIEDFKSKGKKVIVYSDFFDKKNYLLASYADSILLNQDGMVLLDGFSSQKPFVRQLLEKLDIGISTFVSGKYKSALDTFTRDNFSEEDRLQTSFYISEVWNSWKEIIKKNRNKTLKLEIDNYVNNLGNLTEEFDGDTAKLAKNKGLVDILIARTNLKSYLSSLVEKKVISLEDNLTLFKEENSSENKLAVLVASGEIIDGEYTEGAISSENFSEILSKIDKDTSIKGLLLRINSPGGSGFASEVIRQRLELLNKKIPIVISMGDIAASGGYWISMNNNKIIANPFTLTGSIGVWAALPNFKNSLEKVGILFDRVSTSDLNFSLLEPPSENLSSFMQSYVDGSYKKFIKLVSKNREITLENTEKIAQGRIWSGKSAVQNNLIDSLGVFQDGIEILKKESGILDYKIKFISTSPGIIEDLFASFNSFLNSTYTFLGLTESIDIQRLVGKKKIETSLICLVCPELR